MVDFSDTEKVYRFKSFGELVRHYLVFKLFSVDNLVKNSDKLLHWSQRVLGQRLFEWCMKKTVYGQFVGGESIPSLKPRVSRLSQAGINAILDYAVEEDVSDTQSVVMETRHVNDQPLTVDSEHAQFKPVVSKGETTRKASARTYFYASDERCEQNKQNFLSCIHTAADVTESGRPFAAIKLTGLGRVEFLLRLSKAVCGVEEVFRRLCGDGNVLSGQLSVESLQKGLAKLGVPLSDSKVEQLFQELDTDNSGHISYNEWLNRFQPSRQLHRELKGKKEFHQVLAQLDGDEIKQMESVVERAQNLAACASEKGVGLMVDAEQTYFQPAIRHIVVNILMPAFNMGDEPVVYNTVQCYLKNAENSLLCDLALSDMAGFSYGVKLVRGAYISQEREKALSEGYPDPIWPDKESTHHCYNKMLKMLINRAKTGRTHVMVASHNKHSIQHAEQCMKEEGLLPSTRAVVFGQLLGMCDHLTYPLGGAGYQAYKYVPYGPVSEVLPYLLRRAHENSSLIHSASALEERGLVQTELLRRMKTFFM